MKYHNQDPILPSVHLQLNPMYYQLIYNYSAGVHNAKLSSYLYVDRYSNVVGQNIIGPYVYIDTYVGMYKWWLYTFASSNFTHWKPNCSSFYPKRQFVI
jgi:hypothetical protein